MEEAETRLRKKDERHVEVLRIQREAVMSERNKHIDDMKETGKADAVTFVPGDDVKGVGLHNDSGERVPSVCEYAYMRTCTQTC